MRSETPAERALEALERPRATFLSAVAKAVGELSPLLVAADGSQEARGRRAASSLGAFASDRVDAERFAALISEAPQLPPAALEAVGRARAALSALVTAGPGQFVVRVGPGEDLRAAVDAALARLGRAFGAARVAALGRVGAYRSGEHGALLEELRFPRWSRAERRLAPPLVVQVEGTELAAAGLADFLDGSVKLAILAPEAGSPAPLAPLVTPGVFVAQGDGDALQRLAATEAPGVAAVLGDAAARFVHDPAGGPALAERLSVERLPETASDAPGSRSGFRAREELAQLRVLAAASVGLVEAGAADPGARASEPADVLAAWLLRQASLPQPASAAGEVA